MRKEGIRSGEFVNTNLIVILIMVVTAMNVLRARSSRMGIQDRLPTRIIMVIGAC